MGCFASFVSIRFHSIRLLKWHTHTHKWVEPRRTVTEVHKSYWLILYIYVYIWIHSPQRPSRSLRVPPSANRHSHLPQSNKQTTETDPARSRRRGFAQKCSARIPPRVAGGTVRRLSFRTKAYSLELCHVFLLSSSLFLPMNDSNSHLFCFPLQGNCCGRVTFSWEEGTFVPDVCIYI